MGQQQGLKPEWDTGEDLHGNIRNGQPKTEDQTLWSPGSQPDASAPRLQGLPCTDQLACGQPVSEEKQLGGGRGVSGGGGREYPKPTIWVSPNRVVVLGGRVTIRCEGWYRSMEFSLRKAGHPNPQVQTVPNGTVAEFPIPSVGREDGGSYTCKYHSITEQNRWSYPSDPVEIIVGERRHFTHVYSVGFGAVFSISNVRWEHGGNYSCSYHSRSEPFAVSYPSDPVELVVRDPSLARPSISLSPTGVTAPGADVTIRCQGQRRDVRFFLHKAGDLNPQRHMDPAGDGAEFRIPTLGRWHAGRKRIRTETEQEPDPGADELTYAELDGQALQAKRGGPAPAPEPVLYAAINVSRGPPHRFGLEIAEKPSEGKKGAERITGFLGLQPPAQFLIPLALGPQSQWSSTPGAALRGLHCPVMASVLTVLLLGCWLAGHSGVWGAGHEYPKPTISVSPSRVVALGGNVTICCEGRYRSMEFFLRKAGHPKPQVQMVLDGTVAEFPIPSVGREDGGSYTCEYHSIAEQNRSSHPSDPVEIIVGEPSYPKPNISLSPSGEAYLGGAVAVWCRGQHWGVRFVLNKERRHFPPVDSDRLGAVFSISNVSQEDGGSYSCSYHSRSEPFAVSYPSDPVELVVRDPSLPRPSISLSPTGVTAPGADVTIRCQEQRRDVSFFLHKAGDLNPQRHMDPAGDGAEFRIPTLGRWHGGTYSCSYRPRSEPFISSQPSDPVQLVVAEPTLPKPSVSVHPSWGVAPGGNVTIRCRARPQNATFLLYKDGGYWGRAAPMGDVAEFPVASARWEDAGSYSCSYHTTREPVAVSHPSDPAWLVVRDYTRGNIVRLALSTGVLLGLVLILAEAAHSWRRGGR
ncbi:leukocyte immunoglobulin-like receptor subfamily A member 6 [Macrochelys suwanniensis]